MEILKRVELQNFIGIFNKYCISGYCCESDYYSDITPSLVRNKSIKNGNHKLVLS